MRLVPVAAKRMAIMRDGKRVEVQPGETVPEAAEWSHVKAWERMGWIRWVPALPAIAPTPAEVPARPVEAAAPTPLEIPAAPVLDEPSVVEAPELTDSPADEAPRRRRKSRPDPEAA